MQGYYTVKELSQSFRVALHTVSMWIQTGELQAEDMRRPGSLRPSYRITPEAVEEFKARRAVGNQAEAKVRSRRRRAVTAPEVY